MRKKRILIVDDDKDILFLLGHSIKRLAPDYDVTTAQTGGTALKEIQKQKFDLVLTDYMMPEMTGLELVQTIRQTSPETQIILMTAYEPHRLDTHLENVTLEGRIAKPFKIPEVLELVKEIVASSEQTADLAIGIGITSPPKGTSKHLEKLWHETEADMVLLLNTNGYALRAVGETDRVIISRLATFVADNFLAVTELASLLGDNESSFKSSYHEGNKFNIYAYNVNNELLLALVFGINKKPGPIWVYTRQTASTLASLFDTSS
jgi:CheY-like chemotaxis protein